MIHSSGVDPVKAGVGDKAAAIRPVTSRPNSGASYSSTTHSSLESLSDSSSLGVSHPYYSLGPNSVSSQISTRGYLSGPNSTASNRNFSQLMERTREFSTDTPPKISGDLGFRQLGVSSHQLPSTILNKPAINSNLSQKSVSAKQRDTEKIRLVMAPAPSLNLSLARSAGSKDPNVFVESGPTSPLYRQAVPVMMLQAAGMMTRRVPRVRRYSGSSQLTSEAQPRAVTCPKVQSPALSSSSGVNLRQTDDVFDNLSEDPMRFQPPRRIPLQPRIAELRAGGVESPRAQRVTPLPFRPSSTSLPSPVFRSSEKTNPVLTKSSDASLTPNTFAKAPQNFYSNTVTPTLPTSRKNGQNVSTEFNAGAELSGTKSRILPEKTYMPRIVESVPYTHTTDLKGSVGVDGQAYLQAGGAVTWERAGLCAGSGLERLFRHGISTHNDSLYALDLCAHTLYLNEIDELRRQTIEAVLHVPLMDVDMGSWWRHLLAGGVAGAVSRTCTAPLDRLKVMRMVGGSRLQGCSIGVMFRGMVHEGGVRSLWRGNAMNVFKVVPETAVKFAVYEKIKSMMFAHNDGRDLRLSERFVAGSLAGLIAQTLIYPLEVLKTTMVLRSTGQHASAADWIRSIYARKGAGAFYRGYVPNVLGIIPYAGIDLAIYETLKRLYVSRRMSGGERGGLREGGSREPCTLVLLGCGLVSSSCGQLATYPLSLVRTRLHAQVMADGATGACSAAGMVAQFRCILRSDGPAGLYRGLGANFLKVAPSVAISYAVYENVRASLGIKMT